jgi:hypothetical protein
VLIQGGGGEGCVRMADTSVAGEIRRRSQEATGRGNEKCAVGGERRRAS